MPLADELHERLRGVIIECLPYEQLMAKYDREFTLFYLDPPYWASERAYGKDVFGRDDFANLAKILGKIKGKFILSLNDVPEVRKLFKAFHIREVNTSYSLSQKSVKPTRELLISNVKPAGMKV